jgi:excisionase family DNA binding protein
VTLSATRKLFYLVRVRMSANSGGYMTAYLSHSIVEAAKAAGVGRTTIYEAIGTGELKARKHGRRTLILHGDLRTWLESLPCVQPKTT